MVNVGKYTSPMDVMGNMNTCCSLLQESLKWLMNKNPLL